MNGSFGARAAARESQRPCTLSCTHDGVWLWPGTLLTERRDGSLVPRSTQEIYGAIAALHGVGFHTAALMRRIETAVSLLNRGRLEAARQVLDEISLPPVSGDGRALMKAISRRLGIAVPNVEAALEPSYRSTALFDTIAKIHDGSAAIARALAPLLDPDLQRAAPGAVHFDPAKHPRWPKGMPEGGEFRPVGADGDEGPPKPTQVKPPLIFLPPKRRILEERPKEKPPLKIRRPFIPRRPQPETPEPPPGIGHDNPPNPIKTRPELEIPREIFSLPEKLGARAGYRAGRIVADMLSAENAGANPADLEQFLDALGALDWVRKQIPNVRSALDPPRELGELIDAAKQSGPHFGYEVHHIVEQNQVGGDISKAEVEADDNKTLVPYYKHLMISGYYQGRQSDDDLGGLSPREAMRGKTFREQYEYGLKVLRKFGVLQ